MTDLDRGRAIERTRLAWRRTTLTAAAVLLLAVSGFVVGDADSVALLSVSGLALAWLAILLVAQRRIGALQRGLPNTISRSPALLSILVVAYATLGVLLIR